jgi:hypothetical protein
MQGSLSAGKLVMRWAPWAFLVLCASAPALADEPVPDEALALGPPCEDSCPVHVLPTVDGLFVALWPDRGQIHARLIDPEQRQLLGEAVAIAPTDDGYGFRAVADDRGDLFLVSRLHDGRIAFLRGSPSPERRVAPMVLAAAGLRDQWPQGLVVTDDRVDVALTRSVGETAFSTSDWMTMSSRGDHASKPAEISARAFTPILGGCGGRLYAAWERPGVGVSAGALPMLGRTRPSPAPGQASLHDIVCVDDQAWVLAYTVDQLSLAAISPRGQIGAWRSLAVPGVIEGVQRGRDGLTIFLGAAGQVRSGQLDPAALTLTMTSGRSLDSTSIFVDTCRDQDDRLVCGARNLDRVGQGACPPSQETPLVAFAGRGGGSVRSPRRVHAAAELFVPGAIPEPDRLSPAQQKAAADQVDCGTADWLPLADALVAHCASKPAECGEDLVHIVTSCHAMTCGSGPRPDQLSPVSRRALRSGKLTLPIMGNGINWDVHYRRTRDGSWTVTSIDADYFE